MGISNSKSSNSGDAVPESDFDDFHTIPPLSMHLTSQVTMGRSENPKLQAPKPIAPHHPELSTTPNSKLTTPLNKEISAVSPLTIEDKPASRPPSGSGRTPDSDATLLPTMFTWSGGGKTVYVTGTWDNWKTRIPLSKSSSDFSAITSLPPGMHQYKFIVDGHWKYAAEQPSCLDTQGHPSNCVEVQAVIPYLDDDPHASQSSPFDDRSMTGSPPGEYGQITCADEIAAGQSKTTLFDYSKPPPTLPPQLHKSVLNVTHFEEEPLMLPLPHHVMLNHLYLMRRDTRVSQDQSMVILGVTTRYKSKFLSTVFYKPL